MLDREGTIIGWSKSAERLTGYVTAEVLGKPYAQFTAAEGIRERAFSSLLLVSIKKGFSVFKGIRTRKDGSHFFAESFITPMNDTAGAFSFVVLMARDISQEYVEEQKREEYIGIASHELKNPVATLSLFSELLAKGLELDRDKKNLRILRDIQGETARLASLIDDLLVVGTIESGKLILHSEAFELDPFVRRVVERFRTTSAHRIQIIKKGSYRVRADKDRIAQVLINLLTNAVKYSPADTHIAVRIEKREGKCAISVRDFGVGIAKKDQKDIFTRFFRADAGRAGTVAGVGLGLYISKEIIRRHRQNLLVKSALGKGATFTFTLPIA